MMTPFQCYQMFNALKMHFTNEKYDYFKYNKKIKCNVDTFQKRSDRYQYKKLTEINDLENFLVPIISANPKIWVGNVLDNEELSNEWLKRKQARSYYFDQDIEQIDDFKQSIKPNSKNQYPPLLKAYINKSVGVDSIIILNNYIDFINYWDIIYNDDPIYKSLITTIKKTTNFIDYDKQKILQILKTKITGQ